MNRERHAASHTARSRQSLNRTTPLAPHPSQTSTIRRFTGCCNATRSQNKFLPFLFLVEIKSNASPTCWPACARRSSSRSRADGKPPKQTADRSTADVRCVEGVTEHGSLLTPSTPIVLSPPWYYRAK